MIFDQISNWEQYPYGAAWEKAFEFLNTVALGAEEKEYPLQGKDIFARVMSYNTMPPEEAQLEAHVQYVDIQTTFAGSEAMEIVPTHQPEILSPYNEEKDVIFFERDQNAPAKIIVSPGVFAVFFPDDAHMPQLMVGDQREKVVKVVVKVRRDLLKK